MAEKKAPRLTPEQNEARQANRAAKRERAKDARLLADLAVRLWSHPRHVRTPAEAVAQAAEFLAAAKERVG